MQDEPGANEERRHLLLLSLGRQRAKARAVLLVERVWPALWPAVGVLGVFLCLALLDIPAMLPGVLHAALLVGFIALEAILVTRTVRRLRSPTTAEADRRLESATGLRHRPLSVLTDTPASGGVDAALWRAHVARAAAQVQRLRSGWPHPGMAARDPRALRAAVAVAVIACLVVAGPEASSRLLRALQPGFAVAALPPATQVQAWITPPGYTRLPPVFLKSDVPAVTVPAGSHLTVSVTGGNGQPSMSLAGNRVPFQALDQASYQAEQQLDAGGALSVKRDGQTLAAWEVTVVADAPPQVRFPDPPGVARGGETIPQTRLPWEVSHAYGVVSLQAELRLRDRPDASPLIVTIPLPGNAPKSAKGVRQQDLTANPWAGLPVIAHLVARDAPGLTGSSGESTFTLPERRFENPIARALMAVRKVLTLKPDERAAPIAELDRLASLDRVWDTDPGAYLNLRAIGSLLYRQLGTDGAEEAQRRLWQLALHLEEGAAEQTARALQKARDELRQAMDAQKRGEKVDPQEIDKRMKALQDALREHLQALAEQARRDPDANRAQQEAKDMDAKEMQKLAEQMRQDAQNEQMDEARDKMAELDQMLDDLEQSGRPEHGQSERQKQRAEKRQKGQQQMSVLQDVVRREGGILDHSQARTPAQATDDPLRRPFLLPRVPGMIPGQRTPDEMQRDQKAADDRAAHDDQERQKDSAVQKALRRVLGELMQQYGDLTGEVPSSLSDADRAMSDAREALADGKDQSAAGAAQRAIEALQKGGQQMSQQLAMKFGRGNQPGDGDQGDEQGNGEGEGQGDPNNPGNRNRGGDQYGYGWGAPPRDGHGPADRRADDRRDPLGRPLDEDGQGTASDNGRTQVPEQMEEARTRAIQEELRRRGAERARPQPELDYINRLLEQF